MFNAANWSLRLLIQKYGPSKLSESKVILEIGVTGEVVRLSASSIVWRLRQAPVVRGPGPGVRGTSRVRFFLSPPVVKVTAEKDRYRVNILMRFRFRRNDSGTSVLIVRLIVAFATLIKKDFPTYKSFVIRWRWKWRTIGEICQLKSGTFFILIDSSDGRRRNGY